MDDLIRYIALSCTNSDRAIRGIRKALREQNRLNRQTTIALLLLDLIAICNMHDIFVLQKRDKILAEAIDEQARKLKELEK